MRTTELKTIIAGILIAIIAEALNLGGLSDGRWWAFIVAMNALHALR